MRTGQQARPSAARSPYWSGVSAASVSRISDCGKGEACTVASAGTLSAIGAMDVTDIPDAVSDTATGWEGTVGGGAVAGGIVSAIFIVEKSHMLRVANGTCASLGRGKRRTRWRAFSIV
jgi:hypothetical protein